MSTLRRRRVGDDADGSSAPQPRISLESFDLYTKTRVEEKEVSSPRGGGLTLATLLLCCALAAAEIWSFAVPRTHEHLAVDPVVEDRLRIDFDITFHVRGSLGERRLLSPVSPRACAHPASGAATRPPPLPPLNCCVCVQALPCAEANIDAMDVAGASTPRVRACPGRARRRRAAAPTVAAPPLLPPPRHPGEQQNGLEHDISKTRLSPAGVPIGSAYAHRIEAARAAAEAAAVASPLAADYCGPCYGAAATPEACCNTCDAVRAAYAERGWDVASVTASSEQCAREQRNVPAVESAPGEGCRLAGRMFVNKVAGNFHVAIGETHTRGAGDLTRTAW